MHPLPPSKSNLSLSCFPNSIRKTYITTVFHNNIIQKEIPIPSMDSSHNIQIKQQQEQEVSNVSTEIMIGDLLKRWRRRQKWHHLFFSFGENVEGKSEFRTHLINFMESTPVHIISLSLLFIDLVLVTLELSSTLFSCSSYKSSKGHLTKTSHFVWYHALGIGILILLSLKSLALMLGLGFGFFKRPGYVIDCVVVGVALLLEAGLERGGGGGLVVVVSLWRVVRVVESTFELSDEAIEAQIERIVCQFEALKEENEKLVQIILEKDDMIEKLQQEISQLQNHK